jgi:WD40 repeat protein
MPSRPTFKSDVKLSDKCAEFIRSMISLPIRLGRARQFTLMLSYASCMAAQNVPTRPLISGKPFGPGAVRQLSYSPGGRLLALLTTIGFQVRDAKSGQVLNTIVGQAPDSPRTVYYPEPWLSELCWSPDGKRVARANGGIEIWDPRAAAPDRTLAADATDKSFHELAWSPAGNRIAARSDAGVVVWDLDSGRRILIPEQAPNFGVPQISGFAWAPRGDRLAIAAGYWESEVIDLWDVERRSLIRRTEVGLKRESGKPAAAAASVIEIPVYSSKLEWSPDGEAMALSSGFNGLSLWKAQTGRLVFRTPPEQGLASMTENVISLSWSNDSRLLRVGTPHHIRFLKRDLSEAFTTESKDWMRCISVARDSQQSAASFDDGEIVFWRDRNPQPRARLSTGTLGGGTLNVSPDLRYMSGEDGLWDLRTSDKLAAFSAENWGYGQSAWAPDGQTLAFLQLTEHPEVVQLLRPSTGQPGRAIRLPQANYSAYTSVSWSPDGARVLVTGSAHAVITVESGAVKSLAGVRGTFVWTPSGDLVQRVTPIPLRLWNVLQSPDYRYAALRGDSKDLVVWDTQENRVLWTVDFPGNRTLSQVVWSPDSHQLAYVSGTGAVEIWDLPSRKVVERWIAADILSWRGFSYLGWREKLVAVENLGGAIRLWQAAR